MAIKCDNGSFLQVNVPGFLYVDLVFTELLAAREGVKLLDHLGIQKVILTRWTAWMR